MTWEKEVDEINKRRELAKKMGDPENVDRHHKAGKLTVRERIEKLLDEASFIEVGPLTGAAKPYVHRKRYRHESMAAMHEFTWMEKH